MKLILFLLLFFAGVIVLAQTNENISAPHLKISWVAPRSFAGGPLRIGLRFQMDPGWHVYWKNPGDSGTSPKFHFTEGLVKVGPIQWPVPARLPVSTLTNLGYENEVVYLFEVTPSSDPLHLEVKLEWLVCQEECIPGFATLTLERPMQGRVPDWDPAAVDLIRNFGKRIPQDASQSPWKISDLQVTATGLQFLVSNPAKPLSPETDVTAAPQIFPVDGEFLSPAQPKITPSDKGFVYEIPLMPGASTPPKTGFVLQASPDVWEFSDIPTSATAAVAGPVETPPAAIPSPPKPPEEAPTFALLLLMAFAGGVILNFMPCVFPVLSIKLFSLMKDHATEQQRIREALLYGAGVLMTFLALGGAFLTLRSFGQSVGWGFQLQSPRVVLGLALLFWLMGLNFLGVFEMGTGVMNVAGRGHRFGSSFATGVLSVFVAAPCTGPFMGSALGAASTLPPAMAMLIFLGLGLGLAAPFLVLAASPRLTEMLPRPGAWMEKIKEFLSFPLFATVLWLMWVLGQQSGDAGWVIGGSALLILGFALWLGRSNMILMRRLAIVIAIIGAVGSITMLSPREVKATVSAESTWHPYDRKLLDKARAEGRPVFVDFTAAWCISCQVNKKAVLDTADTAKMFADHNTLLMQGDWTNQDQVITDALAEFGRSSVPLYLFYPSDKVSKPQILPQILTFAMLEDLFHKP